MNTDKKTSEKILQWRLRPGRTYATTLSSDRSWTNHCAKRKDRRKCPHCRKPAGALRKLRHDPLFEFRIRVNPCPSVVKT